jgi:hypothetical protein
MRSFAPSLCWVLCVGRACQAMATPSSSSASVHAAPLFGLLGGTGSGFDASTEASGKLMLESELQFVPHVGQLFLDQIGVNEFVLTHSGTHEQVSLRGDWRLIEIDDEDNSGEYALCSAQLDPESTEIETRLARDVLEKCLKVSSDGEQFIVQHGQATSWDLARTRFQEATWNCKLPYDRKNGDFAQYWFAIPRASGLRCYWDSHSIYAALGLTQSKGIPSHWISKVAATIKARGVQCFGHCHMVAGTQMKDPKSLTSWVDKCLPHWSLSTALVVAMSARWAYEPRNNGSFVKSENRSCAVALLDSLYGAAACTQEPLRIYFGRDWQPSWPRPVAMNATFIDLHVCANGIDLEAIQQVAAEPDCNVEATRLWQRCKQLCTMRASFVIPFGVLLEHLLCAERDKPIAFAFASQLYFGIALKFEGACIQAEESDVQISSDWGFKWIRWDDVHSSHQLDHYLVRYTLSCRVVSEQCNQFVIATDGHDGCGHKLLNTAIGMATNELLFTVPQVAFTYLYSYIGLGGSWADTKP